MIKQICFETTERNLTNNGWDDTLHNFVRLVGLPLKMAKT